MNGNILPIEIMARREDWSDGISLYARQTIVDVRSLIAKPLEFTDYQPGSVVDPFIRLEIQTAQQLMDELWQCGLRPTEGTGSAGSLRATEKHLQDMRKIAFKKLGIEI